MNDQTKTIIEHTLIALCGSKSPSRLTAMIGASCFAYNVDNDKCITSFSFKFKSCKKYNKCSINYHHGSDMYSIKLFRITRSLEIKNNFELSDIFCDELQTVFEHNTGLYTSFNEVKFG